MIVTPRLRVRETYVIAAPAGNPVCFDAPEHVSAPAPATAIACASSRASSGSPPHAVAASAARATTVAGTARTRLTLLDEPHAPRRHGALAQQPPERLV